MDTEGTGQFEIRGYMTPEELEQLIGVSVEEIVRALNLPKDLPTHERLGRLSRTYEFDMRDVRKIVRQGEAEDEEGQRPSPRLP
jgi:hypothetical protein